MKIKLLKFVLLFIETISPFLVLYLIVFFLIVTITLFGYASIIFEHGKFDLNIFLIPFVIPFTLYIILQLVKKKIIKFISNKD